MRRALYLRYLLDLQAQIYLSANLSVGKYTETSAIHSAMNGLAHAERSF